MPSNQETDWRKGTKIPSGEKGIFTPGVSGRVKYVDNNMETTYTYDSKDETLIVDTDESMVVFSMITNVVTIINK